jgi:nicotinamide-nucleotide amidase
MNAEIISVGTELLLGQIVDTNAAWMAQRLAAEGVNLYRKQTVGDNRQRVASAIRESLERADLILMTGGLGPTVDDITREAIADATGRPVVRDTEQVAHVIKLFERLGRPAGENNLRQADLPEGARAIPNPVGTAPGVLLELDGGKAIIAMPGVPREMKRMMDEQVVPYLRAQGLSATIRVKLIRTAGVGESVLDEKIADLERLENPTVGLAAHAGRVDIRITARASSVEEADILIEHVAAQVRRRVGDAIYAEHDTSLEQVVRELMDEQELTVVVYETMTGGAVAEALRDVGASVIASEVGEAGPLPDEETAKVRASLFAAEHCAPYCIAVYSTDADHTYGDNPGESLIVAAGPTTARLLRFSQVGKDEVSRGWIVARALDLLRREMLKARERV